MADHNAHTYFGLRVLEQLPADLRTHVSGDMPAFHLGLYGPDPLIFSLLTKHISDRLHKNWRTEALPGLSKALQKGSATARSFAGSARPCVCRMACPMSAPSACGSRSQPNTTP